MIPRPSTRPCPIPFAMPAQAPQEGSRSALTPFASAGTSTASHGHRRVAPGPVHWGDTPGGALVMPAEDPRALYNVTRNWQGQAVALDAPAAPPIDARRAATAAAPEGAHRSAAVTPPHTAPHAGSGTGELSARYTGQGSLCVRSSVTGRHYRFSGHGHTLRIDKHDQMLMRRISDVELA